MNLKHYISPIDSRRTSNSSLDSKQRKLLSVSKIQSTARILNGIIETGEYGYQSKMHNIKTNSISYKRQTHDAEMLPFYYLIQLPKKADEGVVILQRFKNFGIRRHLLEVLRTNFNLKYPNLRIEINPLVPERLIQHYFNNGKIIKIRFVKFSLPKEIEDVYDNSDHEEKEGYTELVVSAKRNNHIPILTPIHDYLKGNKQLNKIIELHDFEYDNVKIEVVVNKTHRTINLGNLQKIRAYYDITDMVKVGESGHPLFESVDQIANDLLGDISKATHIGNSND